MRKKSPPPPAIAAIYARYSSHAQNDASIEQQVAECLGYAEEHNLTVVATYEDRAISGRTDKRPGFQKMLRAAERGEFQALLAYKSNRISRNMQSALSYEQRLNDAGVRVIYCKESFDDTATGRFMLRTMMNMNQFYSENMAEDIRRGMADSVVRGKIIGVVPFGYRKSSDSTYEIDEPAAAIVREIFTRYLAGDSQADMRRDFNARGLVTGTGKPWSRNSFYAILTNEKYIGTYTFGDQRVEGRIPAIIDPDTFAMVQRKREVEKVIRKRKRGPEEYILTGKLFCGHCLAPMVGMSARGHGGEYYYYACQTRRTTGTCKKENVRKEWIEQEVTRAIQTHVMTDDMVEWIADTMMEASRRAREQSMLIQYESQLAANKKQIANIIRAIEMGVAGDEVKERMDELQSEKRQLQALIATEKAVTHDYERTTIRGYLETIRHHDATDPDFQRMLIRDYIRAVYLYDDHFKIIIDFTGQKTTITAPLTQEKVRLTPDEAHHHRLRRTSPRNYIEFDGERFVVVWYFDR